MESETNILVRQILAGALFTFGVVWAVVAGAAFADILTEALTKISPVIFWTVGSLIWGSWGLIAFTSLRRKRELAAWFVSALFHAAMLAAVVVRIDDSWRFGRFALIPIWWAVAFFTSVAAIVLTLRNGEERV